MDDTFIDTLPVQEKSFWKKALKVSPKKGLTTALVEESKNLYGPNRLSIKSKKTLLAQILEQFKELITILLCITAIVSFVLAVMTVIQHPDDHIEYISLFLEFTIICVIIFINIFLSIRQANKTDKALQTLKNLSVPMAKVIRDGKVNLIPSAEIVPGDIIDLEAGETIAADAKLIEAVNLKIDESILTGESTEVEKDALYKSNNKQPVGDRKDWVFSNTTVTNGTALCQVMYTGMNTQVGNIAKLLNEEKPDLTPLQKQVSKLSKIVSIVAVTVCLVTFILYMVAMTGYTGFNINGWGDSLNVSVSLAIASIPETLLPVVSIILSFAVQKMSKQNALIKRLPAIETLGNVSIVCTDKTGTLTKNVMTVVKTWSPKLPLQVVDAKNPNDPNLEIYKYGTLCSDAVINNEDGNIKYIGDSTETAILKGLVKQGVDYDKFIAEWERLGEVPFDADRKMMSVIVPSDKPNFKYMAIVKGAPDKIFKQLSDSKDNNIQKAEAVNNAMGDEALRVLAIGIRYFNELPKKIESSTIETNLQLVGLIGIIDPPKQEAKIAIEELDRAGIRTIMITGDHKTTAAAIARELKILTPRQEVISGTELNLMSDEQLTQNVEKYSVYARVSPNDKLRIVKAWKANGKIVSMTGDGVNDAPSLKAASVGCAMGITGTDVAKDASDMVLMDDNFATIVRAIDSGRKVILNIKSALSMLLTINVANLLCTLIGILVFFISPMRSLQILFINIAEETLLSFGIARTNITEDVMAFKPKNPKSFIVDKRMFIEIMVFGLLIVFTSLLLFWVGATFTNPSYTNNYLRFAQDAKAYGLGQIFTFNRVPYLNPSGAFVSDPTGLTPVSTFLASYHYGSMMCFLTIGLGLSINSMYTRQSGSLFKQKLKDIKVMLLMVFASILILLFVSFVPGINRIFNMDMYTEQIMSSAQYQVYVILPFVVSLCFIICWELYRFIFGKFFNMDGTRKIKVSNTVINDSKPIISLTDTAASNEAKNTPSTNKTE